MWTTHFAESAVQQHQRNGSAHVPAIAFDYFSRIANAHREDSPSDPVAQIVANAFVALGRYYLTGIPNTKIMSDPERAREMFSYAASHFGNASASESERAMAWAGRSPKAVDCGASSGDKPDLRLRY